jgi:hypothetical protein
MPSHDLLVSCVLLLVRETQPQVHFWLVDKLSILQFCLELCQFVQAFLKPGFARRKVSFSYGVERGPNYNILSEWMTYYSRYATGKKCGILGFSLLQLVTSKNEVVDIPEAQPMQLLPCSSHVPAAHCQCVLSPDQARFCLWSSSGHILRILKRFLPCAGMSWMLALILMYPLALLLANCVHGIADHALKLIFVSNFPPTECVPLSTLWSGHHEYFLWLVYRRISYSWTKRFLHSSYLDHPILDRGTLYRFLSLVSPHP